VVDNIKNVGKFFDTYIKDPKWHLVIQFVAGLVGDKIKEAAKIQEKRERRKLMKKWRGIIQERYYIFCILSNVYHSLKRKSINPFYNVVSSLRKRYLFGKK
jgi:hypothetical protein